MTISPKRSTDLDSLWTVVQPIFPSDATCSKHPDSSFNFIVTWALPNQPPELTQISREVSISFLSPVLQEYTTLDAAKKNEAHRHVLKIVQSCMSQYTSGKEVRRGASKTPFVIHVDSLS